MTTSFGCGGSSNNSGGGKNKEVSGSIIPMNTSKWIIPEWGQSAGFEDLIIDSKTGRLYASSANMGAVLIFDLNGTKIGDLTPKAPDRLERASALALFDRKLYVVNMGGNSVIVLDL